MQSGRNVLAAAGGREDTEEAGGLGEAEGAVCEPVGGSRHLGSARLVPARPQGLVV